MKLVAFSKHFKSMDIPGLIAFARETGLDGWDLCVRPGYPVNPDNVASALPAANRQMHDQGLAIHMVTGNFDLTDPEAPAARALLAAMGSAEIRYLKLGYYLFDPYKQSDYWAQVDAIRARLDGWQRLAREHNVVVSYHTHSERCMGLNASALMHLLQGFDPACIGAYLDPAHLAIEGEEFAFALEIVKPYLHLIALKDAVWSVERHAAGHGSRKLVFPAAGEGFVDFTTVFADLQRVGFDGVCSVHCEFMDQKDPLFDEMVRREIGFFRRFISGQTTSRNAAIRKATT